MNEVKHIVNGFLLFLALAILAVSISFLVNIRVEEPVTENPHQVAPRQSLNAEAANGKKLFQSHCASCHSLFKDVTGPALAGVERRWPNKSLLIVWIKNWGKAVATGDPYAVKMKDWSSSAMPAFLLKDSEIDAILAYLSSEGNFGPPNLVTDASSKPVKGKL